MERQLIETGGKPQPEYDKLPSLAKINREIMDKSSELVGQKRIEPKALVEWIADKRGDY